MPEHSIGSSVAWLRIGYSHPQVRLHFLDREPDQLNSHVVSPQIDRDGRIDRWPEGFFDEWDKSLEKLL